MSQHSRHGAALHGLAMIALKENLFEDAVGLAERAAEAIAIHNFPEGLATFASTLKDPTLGVAIAIHSIPEGIAVSIPIYYASTHPVVTVHK